MNGDVPEFPVTDATCPAAADAVDVVGAQPDEIVEAIQIDSPWRTEEQYPVDVEAYVHSDPYSQAELEQVEADLCALENCGYDVSDAGSRLKDSEIARLTDSTQSDTSFAGHIARDDMAETGDMGIPMRRHLRP